MSITKKDEAFLRGLRGRKQWKERDARRALSLCEGSGQSRAAFARQYGLRPMRFAWWKRRLGEWTEPVAISERDQDVRFVELVAHTNDEASPARPAATVRAGEVTVELVTLDHEAVVFVAALSRALGTDACS